MTSEETYFTQRQFAALIGQSSAWVRQQTRTGLLRPTRIGGVLYYRIDMLNEQFPTIRADVREQARKLVAAEGRTLP